jgi:hypothetical protein
LGRQAHAITLSTISPQEDPRMKVPRGFRDEYITLIKTRVVSMDPGLFYNLDETDCSDCEERKLFEGSIPKSMAKNRIHFPVSKKIPHQTVLVCVSPSREAFCPLLVITNPITRGIFQGGVQEALDIEIRLNSSSYANADIFCDYIRDVFIPHVENFRVIRGRQSSAAVLLMDNWSPHFRSDIIEMLSAHNVKVLTFPPHISGIFQMLDHALFGASKACKRL